MDSLATNEEQAIRAEAYEKPHQEEDGDGIAAVANRREFFHEADAVCTDLKAAVEPALAPRACRELCERIGETWTTYQEQPGLLDPFLESMIEPLIGAIGNAVRQSPKAPQTVLPNLHLLSSLLYILTTVRGYKTVSRFFPHEAADLEPCLEAAEMEAAAASTETWSTLYCLTLWLSMVLLTPFDLKTIDSGGAKGLAARILELGKVCLRSTSRTRDASAWMLAKYFTRPDVTVEGALVNFLAWTKAAWNPADEEAGATLVFTRCGVLQAWSQILKAAPRAALKPIWDDVVALGLSGPSGEGDKDFGSSAALRKLRVKVACRAGLVALPPRLASWRYDRGARSLLVNFAEATGSGSMIANTNPVAPDAVRVEVPAEEEDDEDDVPNQIEDVLELLLVSLSNPDTVVRWSAAKGIGRTTNRLSSDFGDQIIESLIERCFSFRETDKAWHGGCLALAELTRRGLLLPERLSTVVPLVCQALHFEQVVGNHTVGQHVRDAACYVCWAFARAYAPDVLEPFVEQIANTLIQVAVYDREINCRRAAAAAVQEHVGRQGTFPNGIDVVTFADYWTLSVRRNAYLVVAPQLGVLANYRQSLIDHLVERKLHHQDIHIRALASQALAKLAEEATETTSSYLNSSVLPQLLARASEGTSSTLSAGASEQGSQKPATAGGPTAGTVASRHGAVLAIAALVDVMKEKVISDNQNAVRNLVPSLEKARAYRGRGGEVVRQAACALLSQIASAEAWPFKDATCTRYLQTIEDCVRHTTEAVQVAAIDALRTLSKLRFKAELCGKCVDTCLLGLRKTDETISARRGYALYLGALPHEKIPERRSEIVAILCQEVQNLELPGGKEQEDPHTRQFAALSLGTICASVGVDGDDLNLVVNAIEVGMRDYSVDRRGDVGSWVREVCMEVIALILDMQRRSSAVVKLPNAETTTRLLALLLQQAVEKIDRLRDHAYRLLHHLLCSDGCMAFDIELAYRRICHSENYDSCSFAKSSASSVADEPSGSTSWPPAHSETLREAFIGSSFAISQLTCSPNEALETLRLQEGVDIDEPSERHIAIFESLVPLLLCEVYRPAIVRGLVVSVGGITESTAKGGRKALFHFLQENDGDCVCNELLRLFESTGVKDSDSEARRILASLFNFVGVLLAQGLFPAHLATSLLDKSFAAVRSSRDVGRLKAAIAVFIGLLRWPRSTRRKAFTVLLQFLGTSFPVIRQATAQALYIRLLEEQEDFDLTGVPTANSEGAVAEEVAEVIIPAATIASVLELISVTPWGTDNEESLAASLREVYLQLKFDLPTGGRSILAPKKQEKKPQLSEYADLVRANHY